jgi:hypothetical protein
VTITELKNALARHEKIGDIKAEKAVQFIADRIYEFSDPETFTLAQMLFILGRKRATRSLPGGQSNTRRFS